MSRRQWAMAAILGAISFLGVVAVILLVTNREPDVGLPTLSGNEPASTLEAHLVELEIKAEIQTLMKTFPNPVWGLEVECTPMGPINSYRCIADYRTRNPLTDKIEDFTFLYDAQCNGTNCHWQRV